jgi:hypothetical protein
MVPVFYFRCRDKSKPSWRIGQSNSGIYWQSNKRMQLDAGKAGAADAKRWGPVMTLEYF